MVPQNGAIPPPWHLVSTQAHLCDTPFCNIWRDNCAIPHKNKHETSFAILSLQVSRDMKSIATGPLSPGGSEVHFCLQIEKGVRGSEEVGGGPQGAGRVFGGGGGLVQRTPWGGGKKRGVGKPHE